MSVPAWVKYNSDIEKLLCKKLLSLGIYDENMNLRRLASDLGFDTSNFCNFPDDKIIELVKNSDGVYSGGDLVENTDVLSENKPENKKKRGRPSTRVNNLKHADALRVELLAVKNKDFPDDIKEHYSGDIVQNDYVAAFNETVQAVKEQFFADYPERIKKHPSTWFRFLCLKVKQNTPKLDSNDFNIISNIWDIYSNLCIEIGINRTIENFQIFTGLNWNVIDKLKSGLSPECKSVTKKIYDSCKADIVGGLSSSYGSSPNQMFIAKSIYGIVENTVVTHVSAADHTKKIDDIPAFIEEK